MVLLTSAQLVASSLALSAATATASALYPSKRIAQVITDATADWVNACNKAGGGSQCQPISQQGFDSLLAAGGNCDQQNAADAMVDLAKQLNNDPDMIRLAQLFVQQPRNAPNKLQVPYCQTAPKNPELNGLFHCQFAGSDFTQFSGDQTGNLPLGVSAVNPPGSCPAKPDGPVPDGVQLNTLVSSPGTPIGGGSGAAASKNADTGAGSASVEGATTSADSAASSSSAAPATATPTASDDAASGSATGGGSSSFALSNGQAAQKLNAQFQTLTASSPCTDGQSACVNGGFAQCVNGAFQSTPCSGGLQCVALPLVNKPGTSVTCDTAADAEARIEATGATGGLTGSGSTKRAAFTLQNGQDAQKLNAQFQTLTASSPCTPGQNACVNSEFSQCVNGAFQSFPCAGGLQCVALPLVNSPGTSITCDTVADAEARIANTGATGGLTGSGPSKRAAFTLQNGLDAQKLNAQFQTLTPTSPCSSGESACVNGQFAQCVGGSFALTPCAGGLQCVALPLVNKPGTSVTCDTAADAATRITATGATGGISGRSLKMSRSRV